jgi:hypothetical protein
MDVMVEQEIEAYAWLTFWVCPVCSHEHGKPHFPFKDQINQKKRPLEDGRIVTEKYQREGDGKLSCKEYDDRYGTGPVEDKRTGRQNPLFCPHCGWCDELIYIEKVTKKRGKKT